VALVHVADCTAFWIGFIKPSLKVHWMMGVLLAQEASSLLPDSACPLPAHSSKDAFLHPNSHETKLLVGAVS
jgi:hypothetical protein